MAFRKVGILILHNMFKDKKHIISIITKNISYKNISYKKSISKPSKFCL